MNANSRQEQDRLPLNWHPIFPDKDAGPIDKIDGYNAQIVEDLLDAYRASRNLLRRIWTRPSQQKEHC